MDSGFVKLSELIYEFSLKPIYIPKKPDAVLILTHKLNRPGLGLCGCYKNFDNLRVQVIQISIWLSLNAWHSRVMLEQL